MRGGERGVALLEVLVALTILGIAGTTAIALLVGYGDALARNAAEERRVADESRLLTALTLLSREDLANRLGAHRAGLYAVEIRRVSAVLYELQVGMNDDPVWSRLETMVYRPQASR